MCVCGGGGGFWSKFIAAEGARECTYTSRELSERVIAGVNFTNKTRLGGYMLPSSARDSKPWCCWGFFTEFSSLLFKFLVKGSCVIVDFLYFVLRTGKKWARLANVPTSGFVFLFVCFLGFLGGGVRVRRV